MSERHVVVGAGPVGRAVAGLLAERAHEVVLVSRSGSGPALDGVRREAADAADVDRLVGLTAGAEVLYNCINPPSYDVWATWWPPAAAAFLTAAEQSGAVLATAGTLYPYGPVGGPMTEDLPDAATGTKARIRAAMWAEARDRHEAGRLRAVEVRGSDYMGPGVASAHVAQVAPRALAGKAVRVFGRPDVPHSFTDVRDVARALVATAATPTAHGRVWHAPTGPARTQAETIGDVCRAVGRPPVPVRAWPGALLGVGGAVVPLLREMRETVYQFERPYLLDSSAIERELGLVPTPWDAVCRATAESALA
ncbi:NAD-dependent epimerase/dehydratase family protein [Nocardioides pantholopis]|uniref:NAD-dependent epimerase/dehydratase family protein n=1 Tax=Nocardioides pantholopis TaxID=2483798 RepID=UPI000F0826C6|nr:NAD-dependent epimerase/dehydratase family protein [Nocardioides pantholopis]